MKQIERSSVMRIASDIIMADDMIDLRELSLLGNIRSKYGITADDEKLSFSTTLEEAVSNLQLSSESLRQDFLGDMENIIMSDRLCTRQEALLLLSLVICLTDKITSQAKVFSVTLPDDVIIEDSQVIYIEGEFYGEYNREIEERYREIVNELRLIGHNFVYLPKVSEHYRQLREQDLRSFVTFLYPDIDSHLLEQVLCQITTLNTSDFCKEQISTRFNLKELSETLPSLLVILGNSHIKGQSYTNLLQITLEDDILQTIKGITDLLRNIFRMQIINPMYETEQRFVFKGFHKQVFDSIIMRKGIRSSVAVDLFNGEILLPEAGTKLSGLHRREKALYSLFLVESRSGGINFSKPTSAGKLKKYKQRIAAIQKKYDILYEKFGGEKGKAPDIELPANRLPMISLIKREFRALGELLNNADDYLVQRNVFGNYCIKLPPELCCSYDVIDKQYHPLADNDFWRSMLAM